EDSAAMAGLVIAFVGVWAGSTFGNPYIDGSASVLIGLVLIFVAAVLAWESRGLLVGEAGSPADVAAVRETALADPDVESVTAVRTMHVGPESILATLELGFRRGMRASEIEAAVDRVETAIVERVPRVRFISVEAESPPEEG
ncbi:MAG: cation transporter dimerization domain-containing protein, partial [Gemmatimonadota bacterium]